MKNKIREYVFSELSEYFKLDENSPSGLVRIRNKYDEIIKEYSVGTRSYRKMVIRQHGLLDLKAITILFIG